MNFELNIIGSRGGYEKYPKDGFDDELKRCAALLKDDEAMVVSHTPAVIHYAYMHRIGKAGSKDYMGLVLSFNGTCFRSIAKAFEVMEQLYEASVCGGLIVHVADNGQVEFNEQSFYEQRGQYEQLKNEAQSIIDALPRSSFTTLPRTYRIGQGSSQANIEDGEAAVAEKIAEYDRVAVIRNAKYSGLSDVQARIARLYEQKVEWQKKYRKERHKKKQYSLVNILLVTLIVSSAISIYVIRDKMFTINMMGETIDSNNVRIDQQKKTINKQQTDIDTVMQRVGKLKQKSENLNKEGKQLMQQLNEE